MQARSLAPRVARALALVARLLAAALVVLVVVLCLPAGGLRPALVGLQRLAEAVVLPPLRGLFVVAVPTGGALRGDLACMAAVLLLAGWALERLSWRG